jgi:hypothetical protein
MLDTDNTILQEFSTPSDDPIKTEKLTEEIWHDMCGEESTYEVD